MWTTERANKWYNEQGWLCGFNYLPRTAVNWNDVWQEETFDPETIEQELLWASSIGYNTLRINLPYVVWQHDKNGLKSRIDAFLSIASGKGISTMLTLLDDCGFGGEEPVMGVQKAPVNGLHNSRAVASPGRETVMNPELWPNVGEYVKDIVNHFKDDPRILIWDLYNEPGNRGIFISTDHDDYYDVALEEKSLGLLQYLRPIVEEIDPIQPCTVGAWMVNPSDDEDVYGHMIDKASIALSDIVSFHAYVSAEKMEKVINYLQKTGRPVICTEWMARHVGSTIENQLPMMFEKGVAAYQWGLVKGKTQTWLPWPMVVREFPDYATQWFHDLLDEAGTPHNALEIEIIKALREKSLTKPGLMGNPYL